MDQKEVPIKNVFEVNEELGDEEQTSKKEKNWKSRRACPYGGRGRGGGGAWLQVKLNHA